MKRWLSLFVVVLVLALLSHGVVLPRVLWANQLEGLQAAFPELHLELDRVVLGLSHKPVLMLNGLHIKNPNNQDEFELGLMRLHLDALASLRHGQPVLEQVQLKGLRSVRHSTAACTEAFLPCVHLMPFRVGAQAMSLYGLESAPHVESLEMEQAVFINQPAGSAPLRVNVEQLAYEAPQRLGFLHSSKQVGQWNLGMKIEQSSGEQLYVSARGQEAARPSDSPRKLENIQVDLSGQWFGGLPWTGSVGVGAAVLHLEPGSPGIQFELSELRSYIRREDAPDTHQAAFSAQQVKGGLPGQNIRFTQAEWTFTHEEAEAWTFDLVYSPLDQQLSIEGRTIAGSEGIPAQAQLRSPHCTPKGTEGRGASHTAQSARPGLSSYWAWNGEGERRGAEPIGMQEKGVQEKGAQRDVWFSFGNTLPKGGAVWALCGEAPPQTTLKADQVRTETKAQN